MFKELSQNYNKDFLEFHPYPTISERDLWSSVDETWAKKSISLAESYLDYKFPALSATDFMDFTRTGNRIRYEDIYFTKRYALSALVLAECAENSGRFTDGIVNGIFSICEESAWCLPPHNSYIRDTPQLPLPDITHPVLDLFACETAAVLATASYLLSDKLNEISPFISSRIDYELERRIYTPYLNTHFWWMGNGKEPMNNWTIWCTQNVLIASFLNSKDSDYLKKAFMKACISIDYFLDEYGEDGCCDEGAQYYRHAGLCLFGALEVLNAVTDGHFKGLYDEAIVKNIASYIMNAHVQGEYYVNFADCSPVAGRSGIREYLFAKRTGNPEMMQYAVEDFIEGSDNTLLLPKESNLYYRLQNAFNVKEVRDLHKKDQSAITYRDIYYPSVGLFISRDSNLYLAVKAGDNADSHNHNDTGSITVYKNGKPLLIDVGVENYTKKTFSPERYDIWTMQSAYHNLPTINGFMQKDGTEYRATDVDYSFGTSESRISMELSHAYPDEAGITSYIRNARLLKGNEIVIEDLYIYSDTDRSEAVLSLMTYEPVTVNEDTDKLIINVGSLGTLSIEGVCLLDVEAIPITDSRLSICWKHDIYRTRLSVKDKRSVIHIS